MQRAARPPHPSITYSTQSVDSRVKIVARCQQASSIFSQPVLGRCACGFRTAAQCAMRAEPHVSDKYPLPLEQNPMLGGQDSFSYKSRRSNRGSVSFSGVHDPTESTSPDSSFSRAESRPRPLKNAKTVANLLSFKSTGHFDLDNQTKEERKSRFKRQTGEPLTILVVPVHCLDD